MFNISRASESHMTSVHPDTVMQREKANASKGEAPDLEKKLEDWVARAERQGLCLNRKVITRKAQRLRYEVGGPSCPYPWVEEDDKTEIDYGEEDDSDEESHAEGSRDRSLERGSREIHRVHSCTIYKRSETYGVGSESTFCSEKSTAVRISLHSGYPSATKAHKANEVYTLGLVSPSVWSSSRLLSTTWTQTLPYDKYQHMLRKAYRELMILGLLSLGLKLLKEVPGIHADSKTMLAFQVADLTIFILALALILQAIIVFSQLRKHNKVADRTELITAQDLVDAISPPAGTPPTAAQTQVNASKWFSKSTTGFEKEVVERRLLRHLFLRRFGLPQLFPFSKYLRRAQANQISHMIEVEPSMWVLLLAVAWGICGALGSLEELDFELPEGHELVEVFVVFAWGLVETAAWRNEAADNALDTMNRVQEELEEIEDHRNAERHVLLRKDVGLQLMATCCRKINQIGDPKLRTGRAPSGVQSGTPDIHIRFFSRKAWHVGVMFLLILNGFFIALLVQCAVYDLDDIYEEFGLAPAIMVPLPLILNTFVFQQRMFRYFVIVCSILRVDANTLGEVVSHFSEIVELRSEFATSLLDCLKEGDYTLIDLRRELHAYDPRQSGLVDVDKLRGVLSAFGFRLTRFRFNSVAMMLFELNGTKVEYGQLLRLLTLAQQEAQSENLQGSQRRQHPLLQRSQTSFEDAGQSSLRVNHSNALGTGRQVPLLPQPSFGSEPRPSDFVNVSGPGLRRLSVTRASDTQKTENNRTRAPMLDRSYNHQFAGSSSRALHDMYNIRRESDSHMDNVPSDTVYTVLATSSLILPPTDLPATVPASLDQETPCKLQEVYFIDQHPQLEYASADAAETSIHEWTKPHNSNVSRNQLSRNDKGESPRAGLNTKKRRANEQARPHRIDQGNTSTRRDFLSAFELVDQPSSTPNTAWMKSTASTDYSPLSAPDGVEHVGTSATHFSWFRADHFRETNLVLLGSFLNEFNGRRVSLPSGQNVEFWRVLAHVSILAVVLLVFEYVLHYVEHHLARFDKYYHMLQKVYRELMILGLISLVLKIVKEVAPIDSSSKPMIAFQVADLIIFGFAIALVLQAMCVFLQVRRYSRRAHQAELITTRDLIVDLNKQENNFIGSWSSKSIFFSIYGEKPVSRTLANKEIVRYRVLRHFFLRRFGLPQLFPFSRYIRRAQANQISHMIEVEPTMWLLVLAVAWGIHGLSTVIEEVSLVKLLVISAWTLVLLHCLVLLYLRSCVHQLLEIAGYSENKSVLYVNLALVAEEEMGAWESETAESALDTMNRVHELQEEIEHERKPRHGVQHSDTGLQIVGSLCGKLCGAKNSEGNVKSSHRQMPNLKIRFFSSEAWHLVVMLLLTLNGFFTALFVQCALDFTLVCSILHLDAHTLGDVTNHFIETVELQSQFAVSVLQCLKEGGLTIAYLETVVRSHDLDHSGLIEIDSLRAILASVGFSLTRFRFSSVVNLLFDLKGTSVEYVQLFQLLVLVQQDHEGDDQRSGFHEFQRRSASFDDKGANNSISAVDLSLSTIQRFGLLNQSSVASDLASSDFAFLRTVSPTLRRISPSGQLPVSKDETHIRRSMLQRSYTNQITGSSSRALHYMYNVRQLTQFQEEAAAKDASMVGSLAQWLLRYVRSLEHHSQLSSQPLADSSTQNTNTLLSCFTSWNVIVISWATDVLFGMEMPTCSRGASGLSDNFNVMTSWFFLPRVASSTKMSTIRCNCKRRCSISSGGNGDSSEAANGVDTNFRALSTATNWSDAWGSGHSPATFFKESVACRGHVHDDPERVLRRTVSHGRRLLLRRHLPSGWHLSSHLNPRPVGSQRIVLPQDNIPRLRADLSILHIDASTLGEVVGHFSETVELRSEFATSLLQCLNGSGHSIADLDKALQSHDLHRTGFIDVDKLRTVLASFGFQLARFRLNSVVKLLFELQGTSVEYAQLVQLVTLIQQEYCVEDSFGEQRPSLQRSIASFDDTGRRHQLPLLAQSSLAPEVSPSDFIFTSATTPPLGRLRNQSGGPIRSDESIGRQSIRQLVVVLNALAICLLVFEAALHYLEHHLLAHNDKYQHMLKKVYRELMILGLLSFIIKMLTEVGGIDGYSGIMLALQVSDLIIFILAITLVLQAINVLLLLRGYNKRSDRAELITTQDLVTLEFVGSGCDALLPLLRARLLDIAGYSEDKQFLAQSLNTVADEETNAWQNEAAESALDTMNKIHAQHEEMEHERKAQRRGLLKGDAGFQLVVTFFRATLRVRDFTASVSEEKRTIDCRLGKALQSHDRHRTGFIDVDKLRTVLASFGFHLARFRLNSVVKLLLELRGTSVEYAQLVQLVTLIQQEHCVEDGFHPSLQRTMTSFDDMDRTRSNRRHLPLLAQSSLAPEPGPSDFVYVSASTPLGRLASQTGVPAFADDSIGRQPISQRSLSRQFSGSSSRVLHGVYNLQFSLPPADSTSDSGISGR
ncbi:EF-hand domain pair [Phytophthora cactorum]|nr:EF-hand domain pair [Phytophthora cactorum]